MNSSTDIIQRLEGLAHWATPLALAFDEAGFSLYAVGGSVRDALLGHEKPAADFEIDFTTDARPNDIARVLRPLSQGLWEQGREFGTIGGVLSSNGLQVEVTTFRSEEYVDHSRKPAVTWGDSLHADLSRRDFTINALALDVIGVLKSGDVSRHLHDPFGGARHLDQRLLTTPIDPVVLFNDDPLRILRAARFAARLHFGIDPAVEAAATEVASKVQIVSEERIRAELDLLMVTDAPSIGLDFLVRTGVSAYFFPELAALQLEQDPIHHHKDVLKHTWAVIDATSPELVLRLGALFHDIGKPLTREITSDGVTFRFHEVVGAKLTRQRMSAMKYSKQMIDDVSMLVELHLRFHTYKLGWSDAAVRRYVRDAGHLLEQLNELTRCDCTTRNIRKRVELSKRMDELEERIEQLRAQEDIDNQRPALDGDEIMAVLGIGPSRDVGRARAFLMEIYENEGEISTAEATFRLREWWADEQGQREEL